VKSLVGVSLVLFGVLLGITIPQGHTTPQPSPQTKAVSCDDTKLAEIAVYLKTAPTSTAQLKRAVAGDANSALELAVMFGKIDFQKMMCLERMAAENGSPVSQTNYGKFLLNSSDPLAQERGKYWLNKAKHSEKRQ